MKNNEVKHTTDFEHFKLYADSVLKSSNKQDLIDYIHMIYHNWSVTDEAYNNIMMHANDLQSKCDLREKNQLTVEEIDLIITLLDLERQRCNIHKNYNRYTEALMILINKLKKQKEMLENEKSND